jgi:predicted permease
VLLFGGLLFSRSLRNLVTLDPGFRPNGLLVTWVDLSHIDIPFQQRVSYKQELLDRIRAIPGIDAAADVRYLPLTESGSSNLVWRDGDERQAGADLDCDWVSGDYFTTMAIPLVAGRDFDSHDIPASSPVAIVNEAFARRLGLGSHPVGQRFRREATPSDPEMVFEIVGLVRDSRYRDIYKGNVPIAYLATSQDTRFTNWFVQILVRSKGAPVAITSDVRQVVRGMSPLATTEFTVYKSMIRDGLLRERLMAALSGFFGVLAALLVTVGVYGVMSYLVACRANEIGIRMTLGADQREVIRMILREAGVLFGAGVGMGLVIAIAASFPARAMVYGVRPYDPSILGAAIALLVAVALAASYFPARRAAKLDPAAALRKT